MWRLAILVLFAAGAFYAWLNGWLSRREERYEQGHAGQMS
jgi:hypothetical protein